MIWGSRFSTSETNCAISTRWPTVPRAALPDGKYHTIRIQTDRKDVIVRARKGYYSVPIPTPGKPAAPPA